MAFSDLSQSLKGLSGTYEIQRILGALGTVTYIVTGPALIWTGKVQATLSEFCLQYPLGLAACLAAAAGAVALKDRQVTKARVEGAV